MLRHLDRADQGQCLVGIGVLRLAKRSGRLIQLQLAHDIRRLQQHVGAGAGPRVELEHLGDNATQASRVGARKGGIPAQSHRALQRRETIAKERRAQSRKLYKKSG